MTKSTATKQETLAEIVGALYAMLTPEEQEDFCEQVYGSIIPLDNATRRADVKKSPRGVSKAIEDKMK